MDARTLALGALLLAVTAPARAQSGARPINPCYDTPKLHWIRLDWVDPQDPAPRDGFLWSATLKPDASTPHASTPADRSAITIEVRDEHDALIGGTIDVWWENDTPPLVAWRPHFPLEPGAKYAIKIGLDNRKATLCTTASVSEQTSFVTTTNELTPAPPAPPFRELVYAHAWYGQAWSCCVPLDLTPCSDPKSCFKCWQYHREPILVSFFDGTESSGNDPLHYMMYFGSTTGRALTNWRAQFPSGVLRPISQAPIDFSSDAPEVCLTAATQNFRTGKLTTQTRCDVPMDDNSVSATDLQRLLGPTGTVAPPDDPDLHLGPASCMNVPTLPLDDEIEVAAKYFTDPPDCNDACRAARARNAAQGAAGSLAPQGMTAATPHTETRRQADGCSATGAGGGRAAFSCAVAMLVIAVGRRRRHR